MHPYHSSNWLALCAASLATQVACDTNAVGVEECRSIEYARCEAAARCPDQFAVRNVEECKLFYRDQCLHGMATAVPSAADLRACVSAIQALSECAGKDGSATVAACGVPATRAKPATVCKLLAEPEVITGCAFLGASPASTGGQAGSSATTTTSSSTDPAAPGVAGAGGAAAGG
ncbi:MAG TPA: hypothetical protein VKP30_34055 [Polyangiaceae bacterium]|nr:hypothetical protein [Polyangiaceae bacterium]